VAVLPGFWSNHCQLDDHGNCSNRSFPLLVCETSPSKRVPNYARQTKEQMWGEVDKLLADCFCPHCVTGANGGSALLQQTYVESSPQGGVRAPACNWKSEGIRLKVLGCISWRS
jgi:hypothetical protein